MLKSYSSRARIRERVTRAHHAPAHAYSYNYYIIYIIIFRVYRKKGYGGKTKKRPRVKSRDRSRFRSMRVGGGYSNILPVPVKSHLALTPKSTTIGCNHDT